MAQVVETHINTEYSLDKEGVILDVKSNYNSKLRRTESEPPYVKFYLNRFRELKGLNGTDVSIMHEILYMMSFKTNMVYIIKHSREQIANNCGITDGVVKKTLTKLVNKHILKREGTGAYRVNPEYFGTGSWQDINKLRVTFEFTNNGETMKLEEIREEKYE